MIYQYYWYFFSLFPGLYLKLMLPVDVDILAERENPTHYADGFHCNIQLPLQGYAMPFLNLVLA
ncbi:hypothetical protein JNE17039_46230 (plasmid) [Escherichia coli]